MQFLITHFDSHAFLAEFLVDELFGKILILCFHIFLLNVHYCEGFNAIYLSTERHTDDPVYLFLLIFTSRACDANPCLSSSLPSFVQKHFLMMMHVIRKYPAFLSSASQSSSTLITPSTSIAGDFPTSPSHSLHSMSGSETVLRVTEDVKKYLKSRNFPAARHSLKFAEKHIHSFHHVVDVISPVSTATLPTPFALGPSSVLFIRLYLNLLKNILDIQEKEKLVMGCHELLDYCQRKVATSVEQEEGVQSKK